MDMKVVRRSYEFQNQDDDFYAELERQILQLTADDDSDDTISSSVTKRSPKICSTPANQLECYFDWTENERSYNSVPTWILNLWTGGNGTGVFIPRIVESRRKTKPRRRNNNRGRIYKAVANTNGC